MSSLLVSQRGFFSPSPSVEGLFGFQDHVFWSPQLLEREASCCPPAGWWYPLTVVNTSFFLSVEIPCNTSAPKPPPKAPSHGSYLHASISSQQSLCLVLPSRVARLCHQRWTWEGGEGRGSEGWRPRQSLLLPISHAFGGR